MILYHSDSFKKLPVMHLLQWNSKFISCPICSISFKLEYNISFCTLFKVLYLYSSFNKRSHFTRTQ